MSNPITMTVPTRDAFALLHESGQIKLVYVATHVGGIASGQYRVFRWLGSRYAARAAWVSSVVVYPLPPGVTVSIPKPNGYL